MLVVSAHNLYQNETYLSDREGECEMSESGGHESDDLSDPECDTEKIKLQHRKCVINHLDSEIRKEYTRFMIKLVDLFKRKKKSVDDVVYAYAFYAEGTLTSEMKEANSVRSFLQAFSSTQSWYNFEMTSSMAEILGGDDGKKLVKSYEAKLKVHLKHRSEVYEVKTSKFVVKLDRKREHFTRTKEEQFVNTVLRVLKIKKEVVLKSIKAGCVELTYLFPTSLALEIRQMIESCSNNLKEQRVLSVSIDG